jgi:K+-transporting ATPase KdpF subunit
MPCSAIGSEERRMLEPIFGLVVALLLGGYLLVTLIRPEKF